MTEAELLILRALRDECRKRHKPGLVWSGPALETAAKRCGVTWKRVLEVVHNFYENGGKDSWLSS
jgi:hypothetical protein